MVKGGWLMEKTMLRRFILLAFCAFALAPALLAEEPTVTAVLTSSETEVGRPVQLQIKITGDSQATPPNDITVTGLDIRYSGQSQLIEGRGLHFTYSFVYNYTVMPMQAGSFTIPAQIVQGANGPLRTPALTLQVAGNNGAAGRANSRGGAAAADERKMVFVELVVPKATAYVGEMVPIQIRLAVNTRIPTRLSDGPNLTGQGFTTQRMPEPQQTIEQIDGRAYQIVTFKTAIAAARSGKIEIGPVELKAVVQVPRRGGGRSPRDLFGMGDPFSDPFFNDPFGGMTEQREITVRSKPATLEVKPLPPHAPPGFAGAVGNFALSEEVKPKNVQVGDPLTVTATLSGRGNFDRVSAPELENDRGWHTYPPNAKFKADDDIGISGTKSFELVLTPNERKSAVPPFVFSYFDPLKETYVTLKGDQLPVVVEGVAPPSSSAVARNATAPRPPTGSATPAPAAQDILYQRTDHSGWAQSFAPLYLHPVFWAAQAVPLLALVGFFAWETRRRRLANREGLRRAGWEHETAELQRKLRRGEDPPDQYFAEALRLVQLKTALARRVEPNTVDAEAAVAAFNLPAEKQERVRELFRRSDELRYSGRRNGNGAVTPETRREVLELVESLS